MGQKPKPNFKSNNQKKSGPQKDVISGVTPSKRQTSKTHHDGLKGNRRNR